MQSFKLKFLGVTILQGVKFPIFLLIFEWALQQCSATALPVIKRSRLVDHRSVPPVQWVAVRRFENHGTPFTEIRRRNHRQVATSFLHERMSLRPSYVLHMRRSCVLGLTTSPRLTSQTVRHGHRPSDEAAKVTSR